MAALFQESPVVVVIEGDEIVKTVLPTEPEDKDESIKASSFFVTAISWNKSGNKIYTGTSKGYLNIIDAATNKVKSFC